MLLVAFWHGLRVSEVTQIKRDDIKGEFLTVRRLKGSRATTQQLIQHTNPLLDERSGLFDYARHWSGNQRLFPISRRQADRLIKQYGSTAGIAEHKLHMHTLKHSCAKYLLGKVELPVIQRQLGHVSLKNTGVYLEVSDEEASSAVQRAAKG